MSKIDFLNFNDVLDWLLVSVWACSDQEPNVTSAALFACFTPSACQLTNFKMLRDNKNQFKIICKPN